MLLKNVLSEYLLELEIQNYSYRTIKSYRSRILNFVNYLEEKENIKDIEKVQKFNIKPFINGLIQSKRKPTYINAIIKSLQSFFKYAIEENIISNNPISDIKILKENKPIIQVFTDKEVENMLNTFKGNRFLPIRDKAILSILIDTGIRCSELINLSLEDLYDTYLVIREPKNRRDRIVSISAYTRKSIGKYIRCRESYFINKNVENLLFLSYRGKRLTVEAVERVVKIAGNNAGVRKEIRCSPHTCRHYYAIKSLKNTLDIYSLSVCLGHTTTNITSRYLKGIKDKEVMELSSKTSPLRSLNMRK